MPRKLNERMKMTDKEKDLMQKLHEKEEALKRISKELLMQREEIMSHKELIENQRDVALRQRDEIHNQQKEITSSITYAKRIQSALLTSEDQFKLHFADHFILYRPKDIVSGDLYWLQEKKNKIVVAVADATGHGVPGAFMRLMGIVFLNEIVEAQGILQPNRILNLMCEKIISSLGEWGKEEDPNDGIDMALISIDPEESLLHYAGAYNPIYIMRDDEFIELRPDRRPLGYSHLEDVSSYTNHEFKIRANDRIYMFSDGYIDQFGWRNNKKFMTKNFKQLIKDIQHVPMKAQKNILENNLDNWMGEMSQLDDILVLGLQL